MYNVLFADIEVSFSLNLFPNGFSIGKVSEVSYCRAEESTYCFHFSLIYSFLRIIGFLLDDVAVIQ